MKTQLILTRQHATIPIDVLEAEKKFWEEVVKCRSRAMLYKRLLKQEMKKLKALEKMSKQHFTLPGDD